MHLDYNQLASRGTYQAHSRHLRRVVRTLCDQQQAQCIRFRTFYGVCAPGLFCDAITFEFVDNSLPATMFIQVSVSAVCSIAEATRETAQYECIAILQQEINGRNCNLATPVIVLHTVPHNIAEFHVNGNTVVRTSGATHSPFSCHSLFVIVKKMITLPGWRGTKMC